MPTPVAAAHLWPWCPCAHPARGDRVSWDLTIHLVKPNKQFQARVIALSVSLTVLTEGCLDTKLEHRRASEASKVMFKLSFPCDSVAYNHHLTDDPNILKSELSVYCIYWSLLKDREFCVCSKMLKCSVKLTSLLCRRSRGSPMPVPQFQQLCSAAQSDWTQNNNFVILKSPKDITVCGKYVGDS